MLLSLPSIFELWVLVMRQVGRCKPLTVIIIWGLKGHKCHYKWQVLPFSTKVFICYSNTSIPIFYLLFWPTIPMYLYVYITIMHVMYSQFIFEKNSLQKAPSLAYYIFAVPMTPSILPLPNLQTYFLITTSFCFQNGEAESVTSEDTSDSGRGSHEDGSWPSQDHDPGSPPAKQLNGTGKLDNITYPLACYLPGFEIPIFFSC